MVLSLLYILYPDLHHHETLIEFQQKYQEQLYTLRDMFSLDIQLYVSSSLHDAMMILSNHQIHIIALEDNYFFSLGENERLLTILLQKTGSKIPYILVLNELPPKRRLTSSLSSIQLSSTVSSIDDFITPFNAMIKKKDYLPPDFSKNDFLHSVCIALSLR